ncbi:hypothetical protein, partial [Herpetosiphon llansteffanensis]|uniref:hypothetical protein n=1 Tax=Herpetosiphon llansteffanensis TaxID=2094568 RepID=UPI0013E0468D
MDTIEITFEPISMDVLNSANKKAGVSLSNLSSMIDNKHFNDEAETIDDLVLSSLPNDIKQYLVSIQHKVFSWIEEDMYLIHIS